MLARIKAYPKLPFSFSVACEITHFLHNDARLEDAWPCIRITELAKHVGREKDMEVVEAACALLRSFGQLADIRDEAGHIEPDRVYPLVKKLYSSSVLTTVTHHFGAQNEFGVYCWFNATNSECLLLAQTISERDDSDDVEIVDEVSAFVAKELNSLVFASRLKNFDTKVATMH